MNKMIRTTGTGYQICSICFSQRVLPASRKLTYSSIQLQSASPRPEPVGLGTGKSVRLTVDLDDKAGATIKEKNLHPKHHPGVFHRTKESLPEKFVIAAERILAHENMMSLVERSRELKNYLWSRHLPIEENEYKEKVINVEERIRMKDEVLQPFLKEEQKIRLENAREQKIRNRLKKLIYHWEPVEYNAVTSLEYLVSRSAGEYSALMRIFNEIQVRDPEFKPNTLCDFGSGVGTVVWASRSVWPNTLSEFLCADMSRDMNDLAEKLLRGGNLNNDHGIPGLFFRQFLPQSSKISYNLVVSAFSLMELPSIKARLEMLNILWKKTSNYLVIVEHGTNAGFQAIIEARDFILQLDKKYKNSNCHIFSPCPNDTACPRYTQDDIPCNFVTKFRPLYPFNHDMTNNQIFSYVVIKKGPRDPKDEPWPRLITNPMKRTKHCICRVCTKEGKLAEVLVTKSQHSQTLYRVARKSHCGDLLPVKQIEPSLSTPYKTRIATTTTDP